MATKGGSGTFVRAPGDDDVAPVIPLRQRRSEPSAASTPRKLLPRERAAFDPELEPGDVVLRRRRPPRAALGRVGQATGRLRVRPRPAAMAAVVAAMAAGVLAAGVLGPQRLTSGGPRRSSIATRYATPQDVQAQMADANADRNRYLLTRPTPASAAPIQHHRARTTATTRRAVTTRRHRSHRAGISSPRTATVHSSAPVTQASGLSGAQSHPTSSSSSGVHSDSGSSSASSGSAAQQSPTLPPGPTGVGSANGCNPQCS